MEFAEILERFGLPVFIIVMGGWFIVMRVWPWVTDYILATQASSQAALSQAQNVLEETIKKMTATFEQYTAEQKTALIARREYDAQSAALMETILGRVEQIDAKLDTMAQAKPAAPAKE